MAKEIAPGEWLIGAQFKGDGSDYYDQDNTGLNTCSGPGEEADTPSWSDVLDAVQRKKMTGNITVVVLGIFYQCANPSGISFICTWKEMVNALHPNGPGVPANADFNFFLDNEFRRGSREMYYGRNTADIIGQGPVPLYKWENDPIHIFGIVLRPS
jgi:hypothetical protein